MNRADLFFERDATGWQFINVANGHVDLNYLLPENNDCSVGFDQKQKRPVDKK